jgi:hypothetical protein
MRRRKPAKPAATPTSETALPIVGVAWFTAENFPAHRALDPDSLQDSFAEWLHDVEATVANLKANGLTVERVLLGPLELEAWCAVRGRKVNPGARAELASEILERRCSLLDSLADAMRRKP